jgi:hypothetical protein
MKIRLFALVSTLAVLLAPGSASAQTPGNWYCHYEPTQGVYLKHERVRPERGDFAVSAREARPAETAGESGWWVAEPHGRPAGGVVHSRPSRVRVI